MARLGPLPIVRHRHTMSGNKLVRLEEDLHFAKQKYLLERGWEYTSKGPGHFWLFCKEFIVDDKPIMLMVAEDLAIQIQSFVDAIGEYPRKEVSEPRRAKKRT